MVLFNYLDSMEIITLLVVIVFVAILIVNFTVQQRKAYEPENKEMPEFDFNNDKAGKEIAITVPDMDQTLGQPSCETGALETHNPPNMLSETLVKLPENLAVELTSVQIATEQQIATMLPRLAFQGVPPQTLPAETKASDLTIGLKIACLVISVSTTGIVSFLAGFPGSQTATTSKLLFKAGILSMCASLFSALVLLILTTARPNFSCLILTARTIMWVSTGLMTLAVVLLLTFYFQMT